MNMKKWALGIRIAAAVLLITWIVLYLTDAGSIKLSAFILVLTGLVITFIIPFFWEKEQKDKQ